MHVEFLTEDRSAEAALSHLAPRLLSEDTTWEIRSFQGRPDLLKNLSSRLRAYPNWLPHTYSTPWCIVVLVDRDQDDCKELKARMNEIASGANLTTRTTMRRTGRNWYQIVNRIAVEELEAWFFGDVDALRAAYPFVSATLHRKAKFRNPDRISGGTWEQLEKILERAYPTGMPKVEVASKVSQHMDPDVNRSPSFQAFRDAVRAIEAELSTS